MLAKSLVRNRHAVTKMYGLKSQLQAVSLRMAVSEADSAARQSGIPRVWKYVVGIDTRRS